MKKTEQPTQLKEAPAQASLEDQLMQQKAIAYDIFAEQQRLQSLAQQVNANIESIVQAIEKQNKEKS